MPSYDVGTVIKVVGVGGAGGNAVNCMIKAGLDNVQFVAVNTDIQALQGSLAATRIPLGAKLTNGRGAGGVPQIGEDAAQEDTNLLQEHISGADMVFVTAGMGGGTGSGAAPVIARLAKEMDILTVGVVSTPYSYEGAVRRENAEYGIGKLRETVDTLLIVPNDLLSQVTKPGTGVLGGFALANDVLRQGVQGISDIVTKRGEVNIDFADIKTVMYGKGDALMGIGIGNGENRALDAATAAINNPLLKNIRIDGAKNILINITGSSDLTLDEFDEINKIIISNSHEKANRIVGYGIDESMDCEVRVTVVATEFGDHDQQHDVQSNGSVAASASADRQTPNYVSLDEWSHIINGAQALESEAQSDNLRVPTVLRQRQRGT